MNRSLNQVVDEIRVWAAAHVQVNEMAYGSIVDIYNRNEINHCIVAVNCNNAQVETNWVDLTLEIAVFDLVDQPTVADGSRPQHEVESDTLQIINDLRKTIEYADRWKDWSEVIAASSAQKYVEHTSDAVTGWMMTLNLRIYSQPGICDLPLINYDYGGDHSATCAPVKIFENGELVDTVPSGGAYSYETGGDCPDTTISIPQAPLSDTQPAGETLVFQVVDEGDVAFTDSQVQASVVGQLYKLILTNNALRFNGITLVGVPFSRRLAPRVDLQNTDSELVPATLINQNTSIFTFELPDTLARAVDSFGNVLATNTAPNGQTVDVEVTYPDCCTLINSFTTEGGGEADGNGTWTVSGENQYSNGNGWLVIFNATSGQWRMEDSSRNVYYLTTDRPQYPWQGTWQIGPDGTGPVPTFEQICEPCCPDDIPVEVNGSNVGNIALELLEILLTDGTDPVVPDDINLTGNVLTFTLPSGGATFICSLTSPTGRAGQEGNAAFADIKTGDDPLKIAQENPYGHFWRFCTGIGYWDGLSAYLHDGTPSNVATVAPDNIWGDYSQWNPQANKLLAFVAEFQAADTFANARAAANSATVGGFNDWDIAEYFIVNRLIIIEASSAAGFNRCPISSVADVQVWTSTDRPGATSRKMTISNRFAAVGSQADTTSSPVHILMRSSTPEELPQP